MDEAAQRDSMYGRKKTRGEFTCNFGFPFTSNKRKMNGRKFLLLPLENIHKNVFNRLTATGHLDFIKVHREVSGNEEGASVKTSSYIIQLVY